MSNAPLRQFSVSRNRLWLEFSMIFVLAPVCMALIFPPGLLFPALFAVTGIGLWLLHRTPGFQWADLTRGRALDWKLITATGIATFVFGVAVMLLSSPENLFILPRTQPQLMLMILVFYPVVSALPQEIIFRPLFFRRYGAILPSGKSALWINAGVFALAHLMYWNWVVLLMTFFGGLLFAKAYEVRGSFKTAVVAHAVAGDVIFLVGLGIYFYSGNVVRPF